MTKMREQEPVDRFKAVWLIFLILGLGTLLPWNFFMNGVQYFKFRLEGPDASSAADLTANGTSRLNVSALAMENHLQRKFGNVMTLCAMLPMLIFSCLNSLLLPRIPQKLRISGSLIAIIILFLLTAILVKIPLEPLHFFVITMVTIVFINCFGAVLQGSLFGLAGLLPPAYTTPIMSGQGLAGTFAALSMICAIASGSNQLDIAVGFFSTACAVVLLAVVCYHCLPQLAFSRYHFKLKSEEWRKAQQEESLSKVDLIKQDGSGPGERPCTGHMETHSGEREEGPSIFAILRKVWPLALQVWFVFTVTISVFPAVTMDADSTVAGGGNWGGYFIPISCFLVFNLFDWFGRSLTAFCMWPRKGSKWLVALVITRLVFIPLFMLCNVHPRQLPVVFAHDAWYICFMVLFAFSNGYLASLCMCYGPQNVSAKEAEMAGAIMSFFLSLGLASGAFLGFLVRALV